ncbi:MAG: C39 family peptidase [Lachnospiraceae bacterium]|nr:C39 family peptidase [Lachnospiraceae bacterium]
MKNGGLWQELEVRITAERLRAKGYPDDLVEFYERHPETREFVVDYFAKKDNHPYYDLSGEITKGEVPLLLQWDERWGYEMYSDEMMALSGCGPTSLAMVGLGLTGDTETFDPLAVARFAVREGCYEDGVGTSWALFSEGAEMLGLRVHMVAPVENAVRDFLDSGNPVICSVGPGDFTEAGHFIVLTAIDADGNVTVRDPVSPARSKKTWPVGRILGQVRNLWGYSVED